MRDRFGATNPRAQQLRFHTQTAGSTLTAQQPDNNIVRVALQALAAVMGGTQSLHCNGRDEALALPTEESARMALRTQQVIAAETGVANTVDPFGGAYADRGADQPHRRRRRARCSIASTRPAARWRRSKPGIIQREIQESAYRAQQEIDAGERVVVGVNRFAYRRGIGHRRPADRSGCRAPPDRARPASVRGVARRRGVAGRARCGRGRRADGSNLVPPIIGAVEARATVGEISDTLRAVFGEHKEIDA